MGGEKKKKNVASFPKPARRLHSKGAPLAGVGQVENEKGAKKGKGQKKTVFPL